MEAKADTRFPRRPRRLRKLAIFALLAVMVLGLLGGAYAAWQWNRTVLTVVNQSGGPVDCVVVSLVSGHHRYGLGRFRDGEAKLVQVFPGGEDDMTLRFLDGKRAVVWHGYVEGAGGHRLVIGKNDAVRDETGRYSP
jgi:hypothetical protein